MIKKFQFRLRYCFRLFFIFWLLCGNVAVTKLNFHLYKEKKWILPVLSLNDTTALFFAFYMYACCACNYIVKIRCAISYRQNRSGEHSKLCKVYRKNVCLFLNWQWFIRPCFLHGDKNEKWVTALLFRIFLSGVLFE